MHGGGVAGALRRAAGEQWQRESFKYIREHGPIDVLFKFFVFLKKNSNFFFQTGKIGITGAGQLNCTIVVHAVGPVWKDGHHNEIRDVNISKKQF